VVNVTGLLITTNHKSDGIYLPEDDRRHYIAWSTRLQGDFDNAYRDTLWHWLEQEGGNANVAAYLRGYDLAKFNPYAPPPRTAAFRDILLASAAPEDTELGDAIALLPEANRDAVTLVDVVAAAPQLDWLLERRSRRAIPHRFERCGYVPCHNPDSQDGRWTISGRNQIVYVQTRMAPRNQFTAARRRCDRG
jgi:hypothetical protein